MNTVRAQMTRVRIRGAACGPRTCAGSRTPGRVRIACATSTRGLPSTHSRRRMETAATGGGPTASVVHGVRSILRLSAIGLTLHQLRADDAHIKLHLERYRRYATSRRKSECVCAREGVERESRSTQHKLCVNNVCEREVVPRHHVRRRGSSDVRGLHSRARGGPMASIVAYDTCADDARGARV